jgi:hypothetical protein
MISCTRKLFTREVDSNDQFENNIKRTVTAGFYIFSFVQYSKEHFSETEICFHPQMTEWEMSALCRPLETANLNHWSSDWGYLFLMASTEWVQEVE